MKVADEIITNIETGITALGQIDISKLEKSGVHMLSARLMGLTEKLNKLAYMMLYTVENQDPTPNEDFKKLR
ncbi:MAG: hypothetical protein V3S16_12110 [Candidatus Desulfatibia sp.]|uniref:hypothetical protein n=1 Tax=Candidatus Desulfatibia sp. TaxID=3101189 RepID=UPI002F2E9394